MDSVFLKPNYGFQNPESRIPPAKFVQIPDFTSQNFPNYLIWGDMNQLMINSSVLILSVVADRCFDEKDFDSVRGSYKYM